jgi:hypothetical protein
MKSSQNKAIKIEKFVLKIGDKSIELSVDEAKELRCELEKLLGNNYPIWYPYAAGTGTYYIPQVTTTYSGYWDSSSTNLAFQNGRVCNSDGEELPV